MDGNRPAFRTTAPSGARAPYPNAADHIRTLPHLLLKHSFSSQICMAKHASAESQKRLHRCFGRQPPRCPHRPCSVSPGSGTAQHLGDSSSAAHSRTSFCPRAAAESLHPHCSRPPRTRHGQQSQHRAGRPRLPLCLPGPGPVSHVLPGARQLSHRRSVLEARGPSAARLAPHPALPLRHRGRHTHSALLRRPGTKGRSPRTERRRPGGCPAGRAARRARSRLAPRTAQPGGQSGSRLTQQDRTGHDRPGPAARRAGPSPAPPPRPAPLPAARPRPHGPRTHAPALPRRADGQPSPGPQRADGHAPRAACCPPRNYSSRRAPRRPAPPPAGGAAVVPRVPWRTGSGPAGRELP